MLGLLVPAGRAAQHLGVLQDAVAAVAGLFQLGGARLDQVDLGEQPLDLCEVLSVLRGDAGRVALLDSGSLLVASAALGQALAQRHVADLLDVQHVVCHCGHWVAPMVVMPCRS